MYPPGMSYRTSVPQAWPPGAPKAQYPDAVDVVLSAVMSIFLEQDKVRYVGNIEQSRPV